MNGQLLAWLVKGPAHARADNQPRLPNDSGGSNRRQQETELAKAARMYEVGGPEVLRYPNGTDPVPPPNGIGIHQRHALQDAVQAHRDLEPRKTTGSSIFVV